MRVISYGIPPFAGFFSKFLVIFGAVYDQNILAALIFIICAGLTVLYTVRLFRKVFLGGQKEYPHIEKENLNSPMVFKRGIIGAFVFNFHFLVWIFILHSKFSGPDN
jgi:NADH:ubiquinone oxidoreductase subunit 2 (subunit N)